jgi:hypothetical protein
MKNCTLLFLFFFISFQTLAQKSFTGLYSTSKKGFESEIFDFKENGNFKYAISTCTGNGIGTGKFQVIEDSLILNFGLCDECPKSKDIQTFTYPSDSLEIELVIFEADSSRLRHVQVYFPKTREGKVSDKNGIVKFKVAKKGETTKLIARSIGYQDFEIAIPNEVSKVTGTINMASQWLYESPAIKKYKVQKWTKSKLILKRNNIAITHILRDAKYRSELENTRGVKFFK